MYDYLNTDYESFMEAMYLLALEDANWDFILAFEQNKETL